MQQDKITDLPEIASVALDDVLEITDVSAGVSNRVTVQELRGGEWYEWTPSFGGTSGHTFTAKYSQIGRTVHFSIRIVMSGANVSGQVYFSLPVSVASGTEGFPVGFVRLYDANGSSHDGVLTISEATSLAYVFRKSVSGSNIIFSPLSATTPFTWAASDEIRVSGFYEAA